MKVSKTSSRKRVSKKRSKNNVLKYDSVFETYEECHCKENKRADQARKKRLRKINTAELASCRTKAAEKNRGAGLRKTKKTVQPTI